MKVKDLERTANVAWSPKDHTDILLAAGTAAQQLDASFNTNATLEIYSLNLSEPGPDMVLKTSMPSEHRFHRVIWGANASKDGGTIVGGCDGGLIQIYNASKLLAGEGGVVSKQVKHNGPVHALDFNHFQRNLFATGAGESEIFIWDLNNTNTPMSPGSKSQPLEDVLSIAWNKQVQHILASTFSSKCVVWDLRKNEPIIKLTDTVSRVRWKVVEWHPEVATQLCLASEEDHSPVIQLWDLRFATSPLRTLENHHRGILSMAWCPHDSDLLVSCGKDNRILCWNPNSSSLDEQNAVGGEVLSEIAKTNQWNFDVSWCPRNPALIACPNFDGHVTVYSIMGGRTQQVQTTNKIADSFPGMVDGAYEAPVPQQGAAVASVDPSRPPKWMRKPVGASFGFGGKLVSFENSKSDNTGGPVFRSVQVSQVITEPELVQKSARLEEALEQGNFTDYCLNKADSTSDQHKKYIWHFLRANFEENPRAELLNLLGYKIEDVNNRLEQHIASRRKQSIGGGDSVVKQNTGDPFDSIGETLGPPRVATPIKIETGDDTEGLIAQALLLGNVDAAVDLCLQAGRFADAIMIAMTGGPNLLARTQHAYLDQCQGYVSSLISALVSEDWSSVINNCDLSSWKEALAATLTHSTDDTLPSLCEQLGKRLSASPDSSLKRDSQLCYICSGSFDSLVNSWSDKSLKANSADLQELVELVMFLQKSIERQGRQVQMVGPLAELLTHYASLLASQGNLQTALAYLGESADDQKVADLRERLLVNLGQKQMTYSVGGRQQPQSRRQSHRQSFSSAASPPQQPWQQQQQQQPFGLPAQPIPQLPQQPQMFQPQPARTFSPVAPPPRPPSTSGVSGGGILSRSKYVLDPSVTSAGNPYGGPTPRYNPQPPDNFASNSYYQPLNPMIGQPAMGGVDLGQPAVERAVAPPPPQFSSAPGWNDPPAVTNSLRAHQKHQVHPPEEPQQPITHPIFGSAPSNGYDGNLPPPGYQQYPNAPPQMFQPPPTQQQFSNNVSNNNFAPPPFSNNEGAIANNMYNPSAFKQNAIVGGVGQAVPPIQGFGNHAPANNNAGGVVEKPQPVPKAPIPEEHMHMRTVLDELKNQCSCAANNPQTKRKLEDVGRKLEALYDLLREHKLSPNTLASLHQMVQLIQNGDYTGGLNLHTQLVSGPDFAQIASFMPGLKVLLQCALQLQVYLR